MGEVLEHDIQVDLISLSVIIIRITKYRIEGVLLSDDVVMTQIFQDCQLSVGISLILVNFLDGNSLILLVYSLVYYTEGAISTNSNGVICRTRCYMLISCLIDQNKGK